MAINHNRCEMVTKKAMNIRESVTTDQNVSPREQNPILSPLTIYRCVRASRVLSHWQLEDRSIDRDGSTGEVLEKSVAIYDKHQDMG